MAGEIETLDLIGDLPSNWKVARFGDVLDGGTRNGIYKTKEFHGSGAKVVNMGELFANPRLRDVPMKRVQLTKPELEKSSLNAGDLLFARRSLVAEGAGKCIVVSEVKEPTTFESSIIRARPNPAAADSLFLYYLFNSPYGAYVLLTIRRQVAVSGITGTDLVELPIPLPPLAEQKAIAAVLGALDDKIELNRLMNATLEAMARALFQSWFIDFDPVRQNMDRKQNQPSPQPSPAGRGRSAAEGEGSGGLDFDPVRAKLDGRLPAGLDKTTTALFPDSFQDSSLGHIPKGWKVATIDATASVGSGKRPVGRNDALSGDCNIPLYGGGGRMGYVPSPLYDKPILFTGRVGTLGLIFRTTEPSWPSDNTLIVEPQDGFFDFTYFVLKGFDLITLNRGSTQPLLTQTDLKSQRFVLPPAAVVKTYAKFAAPIFQQITANENQSRTLATLRDTLLPKLLSGKIRSDLTQ